MVLLNEQGDKLKFCQGVVDLPLMDFSLGNWEAFGVGFNPGSAVIKYFRPIEFRLGITIIIVAERISATHSLKFKVREPC
jgi:hypothetical protein